jgi:Uma2 family endonuclease
MPRTPTAPARETLADLLDSLGGIAPRRVRLDPPPGKATEKDLARLLRRTDRLYELVDGALVEKMTGIPESSLAAELIRLLGNYLAEHDLGFLTAPDGPLRLLPGLVRLPDVSFISWQRVPVRGVVPDRAIADLAPDLAVEVLSRGNKRKEVRRKLKEYFLAGSRLVWIIDPRKRTVQVHTSPEEGVRLGEGQTLDGGDVLPGFTLPLRPLFARLPKEQPRPGRPKRRGKRK